MNKFWKKAPIPFAPTDSSFQKNYALHRAIGDIPDLTPANDVFSFEEGYLVIKNPSVRQRNYYAD